jgi:Plavaka transposase
VLHHIALYLLTYGFHLATPEFRGNADFRKFRRQLVHSSLAKILKSLKPGMKRPEVVRFPDGHFRKVIYSLGPFISDYPEQALLACIVQGWCPRQEFLSQDTRYTADERFQMYCTRN